MQIFCLIIHFEILELNCCNLNKNTRRNIKSRINDDLIERKDSVNNGFETQDEDICINKDDFLSEQDGIIIELNQIKEEQDYKDIN